MLPKKRWLILLFALLLTVIQLPIVVTAEQPAACFEYTIAADEYGGYYTALLDSTGSTPALINENYYYGYTPGELITQVVMVDSYRIFYVSNTENPVYNEVIIFTDDVTFAISELGAASARRLYADSRCAGASTIFVDGRLNYRDLAARAAVYQTRDGYEVWRIDDETGEGTLAFTVTVDEIFDAFISFNPDNPVNKVIRTSDDGVASFIALSSYECQLNYTSLDGFIRSTVIPCLSDFASDFNALAEEALVELGG
ncbi:MAG: hypothetical protein CL607_00085 [Anaerolineaceae bacterium]|nr:hypothetical protein [Anaerolineaceae bacterium]